MAVSIEGRVPLLDHELVELCYQIPDDIRFHNGNLKGLFKSSMLDVLGNEIINLPKSGFCGPVDYWIKGPLRSLLIDNLIENPCDYLRETVNHDEISKNILYDNNSKNNFTLFSLLIFDLWYKEHLN